MFDTLYWTGCRGPILSHFCFIKCHRFNWIVWCRTSCQQKPPCGQSKNTFGLTIDWIHFAWLKYLWSTWNNSQSTENNYNQNCQKNPHWMKVWQMNYLIIESAQFFVCEAKKLKLMPFIQLTANIHRHSSKHPQHLSNSTSFLRFYTGMQVRWGW